MINNGDVGKSCLITFYGYDDEDEVDIVEEEAVAVAGGPTTAKNY